MPAARPAPAPVGRAAVTAFALARATGPPSEHLPACPVLDIHQSEQQPPDCQRGPVLSASSHAQPSAASTNLTTQAGPAP